MTSPIIWIKSEGSQPYRNPAEYERASQRADEITRRLAPHQDRMVRLASQAIRANSNVVKVAALRELLDYLAKAAKGLAACGKGCGACCHINVTMSEQEAAVISKEIGVKARPLSEPVTKANLDERKHYGDPCPFLKNNECSIYASRPLACRTQFNMGDSAAACEVTPGAAELPEVLYLNHTQYTNIIAQAFIQSAQAHGDIRDFFPHGAKNDKTKHRDYGVAARTGARPDGAGPLPKRGG